MIFYGQVRNGHVDLKREDVYRDFKKTLEGQDIELHLEKRLKSRTARQNRYMWAYLRLISEQTGDDENSLHEYFKRKLLPPQTLQVMNTEIKVPASTTKLKTKEFSNYIDRISALTEIEPPPTILYGL